MESNLLGYALFLLSYLVSTIAFYRFSFKELFAGISESKGRLDFLPIVWGLVQFLVCLGAFYIFSLNYLWNAMPVLFFPLVLNTLFLVLFNSITEMLSGHYEKVRSGMSGYLIHHAPLLFARDFLFLGIALAVFVSVESSQLLINILYFIWAMACAKFLVKQEQDKPARLETRKGEKKN